MFLYKDLADRFEDMIGKEVLKVGEKLPSVRLLSKEQGVSISTAYQAYVDLESRGLIEARPKSGYYVKYNPNKMRRLPKKTMPSTAVQINEVEDIITAVYQNFSDVDLIKFSNNMPSLALLPTKKLKKSAMEIIRKKHDLVLRYANTLGDLRLRKQIARLAFNYDVQISEDEIIVTTGTIEAINIALKTITEKGDAVAVESPTFFGIFQCIEILGLKPIEIPTCPENGVDLEQLNQLIPKHNIKACVFVPNFSNPLGSVTSDQHKQDLVKIINQHQIQLIECDLYGEIYFQGKRPRTCKTYDIEGNVILCSSVSKTLAPGYRVGWIFPGKFHHAILRTKIHQTIASPSLPQHIIAHFLENGRYDLHIKKLRKILYTQSLRYLQAIGTYFPEGTKVSQPKGGFIFWLEFDKRLDTFETYKLAIKKGISIAPGQMFSKQSDLKHCMRLCFGVPYDDKVEKALEELGNIIKKQLIN